MRRRAETPRRWSLMVAGGVKGHPCRLSETRGQVESSLILEVSGCSVSLETFDSQTSICLIWIQTNERAARRPGGVACPAPCLGEEEQSGGGAERRRSTVEEEQRGGGAEGRSLSSPRTSHLFHITLAGNTKTLSFFHLIRQRAAETPTATAFSTAWLRGRLNKIKHH